MTKLRMWQVNVLTWLLIIVAFGASAAAITLTALYGH